MKNEGKKNFEKEKEKMSMPRPVVTTETPITVNVSKSQGYIWDASDAIKLRDEHRVLGLAVGSLANHNSQNQVRMNVWLVVERRRMCSGFRWNCPICFAGHSCAYQAYRLAKRMPCNMSATNIKYIYIYIYISPPVRLIINRSWGCLSCCPRKSCGFSMHEAR